MGGITPTTPFHFTTLLDFLTFPTFLETGRTTSRQQLLIALLQSLHIEVAALGSVAATSAIPARVAAISSWVQGRRVEVHGPQSCIGITDGLDARGFLRVRTANGTVTVTTGGIRDAQN